jgi:hypothetical protein
MRRARMVPRRALPWSKYANPLRLPQLLKPGARLVIVTDEACQVIDFAEVIVKPDGRLPAFTGISLRLAHIAKLG